MPTKRKPTLETVREDLLIIAKAHGFVPHDKDCLSSQLQELIDCRAHYTEKRLVLEALLAVEDAINWDN